MALKANGAHGWTAVGIPDRVRPMTAGEYVSAFASIILALAITDLATSMHRLMRARGRVRWDWIPLAVALPRGAGEASGLLTPRE